MFEKVVDGEVVTLNVERLLNGVETASERASVGDARAARDVERTRAARVFVSYSHKDERQLNELKTHLSPLERQAEGEGASSPSSSATLNGR